MPNGKILYEGYLEKKEKKWEAFWVRLIDSRIYFYQEKYVPTEQYHGFLELSGTSQCSTHKSKKCKYQFKIKTEKGVFLFQTITEDERTSWMANILLARDRKVRSISTGNLSNLPNSSKHSDGPIWSRRRPSSATGIPSSRSTDKGHLLRPCSAESSSKSQTGTIDKFGSGITHRNRSASCNDVPTSNPPPIHMETHPTLRRKQDNFVSKSPTDTNKRSKFFSLPGFRQLSDRFSRSQENVGEIKILRNENKLHATRARKGGSLNLDIEAQSVPEDFSTAHRSKDFDLEQLSHSKGFPPRSASVCSDQSTASKTSAQSTRSLDRKSKKRRDQVKNFFTPEKETNIISSRNAVNKLSGLRCQLNGPIQVPQNNEPTKQQPQNKSSSSKSINTHSMHTNIVAKKPPTPTRHIIDTVQYENEQTRLSQSDPSIKPPIPTKRQRNGALTTDGLANEIEDRRGHHIRNDRSAVLSGHTDNQKETELTQQRNGTDIQNRNRHNKNPFYENEAVLYNRFSWFHGDLTREDAENLLKFCGKVGSFLIRNSKKHSKHLCLSLRYSDRIRHFKIDRSIYGYSIDGLEGCYTNLNKLVEVFISWNDNMVKPLDKVIQKQTRDIIPGTPPLETESLIYEDMSDDII